jgi:hypothetical protein
VAGVHFEEEKVLFILEGAVFFLGPAPKVADRVPETVLEIPVLIPNCEDEGVLLPEEIEGGIPPSNSDNG